MTERLQPHERVRRRTDFEHIYAHGAKRHGRFMTMFVLARADAGGQTLVVDEFYLDELAHECVRGVSVVARSNYDLFLTRALKHATLVRAATTQGSADAFLAGETDVLAGVKQRVDEAARRMAG